ncbi:MAG TPA: glycosyltransferase family A protein [Chthonomonadaceae bacterium]|nr:glycosyltransferase family A protein [Chthonomonadaceae bacterium]
MQFQDASGRAAQTSKALWRVSVIIPLYQGENYITSCLESVLQQTYPVYEVLVVDDGSQDRGPDIVRRYGDPVRLITQPNGGPGAARNTGCAHATGDILAFLDQDDLWLPEKLERQLPYFSEPQVGLVHCAATPWNLNVSEPRCNTFDELWERNRIVQSSVLLRRSIFEALGPFETDMVGVEDYNYWLRVAAAGHGILHCPGKLCDWTEQPTSYSRNTRRMFEAECRSAERIAALVGMPDEKLQAKRVQLALRYGREMFTRRELAGARSLYYQAACMAPSLKAITWLLATFLPRFCLNLVRPPHQNRWQTQP